MGRVEKMNFTEPEKRFKSIQPGDEHFMMNDGLKVVPRASLMIKNNCPDYFRTIIAQAYNEGWLVPVANVKTKELFWEVIGD